MCKRPKKRYVHRSAANKHRSDSHIRQSAVQRDTYTAPQSRSFGPRKHFTTNKKFAEPTARGVLDPPSIPVFACYCTILFASRLRHTRSSANVSRGIRKPSQKNIDFLMPFCHLASKLAPFWDHLSLQFLDVFPMRLFWKIAAFPLPQILNLVLSPKRRALDVHEVVARVANPSSWTATGSLGAHLDPR